MIVFNSLEMTPSSESSHLIEAPEAPSRSRIILTRCGWAAFGIFSLLFFTLLKLPDDRLKGYMDNHISSFLAPKGITYSSTESSLSILFGPSYTLKDVNLVFPPPNPPGHIDRVNVSPSLFSLLLDRFGGSFSLSNAGGELSGSGWVTRKGTSFSTSYKAKKFELGKSGLLPALAGLQLSGVLDGRGSLGGNLSIPSTLEGTVLLQLGKVTFEPQSIAGFSLPKLNISEAMIEVVFDKGKATIKTLRLGKQGNAEEDIQGTITGDVTLGKQWESSTLNLKARFSLSESVLKSFVLLDAILGGGKQADGSYAFSLTGPVASPLPAPLSTEK